MNKEQEEATRQQEKKACVYMLRAARKKGKVRGGGNRSKGEKVLQLGFFLSLPANQPEICPRKLMRLFVQPYDGLDMTCPSMYISRQSTLSCVVFMVFFSSESLHVHTSRLSPF